MIDYHARLARVRSDWSAFLARAAEVGDQVDGGGHLDKDQLRAFAAMAVRLGDARFPLPYASASSAAAGFRHLVRGFNDTAIPALRQDLGRAMAAAARCCAAMIARDDEETLEHQRRQRGED